MSYVILGRSIKNEYLAIGTLFSTGFLSWAATRGGSKSAPAPAPGQSVIESLKEAVPINASSSEEEQFIREYVKEAEAGSRH